MPLVPEGNIKLQRRALTLGRDWGHGNLMLSKNRILLHTNSSKKVMWNRSAGPLILEVMSPLVPTLNFSSVSSLLSPNCVLTTFDHSLLRLAAAGGGREAGGRRPAVQADSNHGPGSWAGGDWLWKISRISGTCPCLQNHTWMVGRLHPTHWQMVWTQGELDLQREGSTPWNSKAMTKGLHSYVKKWAILREQIMKWAKPSQEEGVAAHGGGCRWSHSGPWAMGVQCSEPQFSTFVLLMPDTDLTPQHDLPSLLILSGCVTHGGRECRSNSVEPKVTEDSRAPRPAGVVFCPWTLSWGQESILYPPVCQAQRGSEGGTWTGRTCPAGHPFPQPHCG